MVAALMTMMVKSRYAAVCAGIDIRVAQQLFLYVILSRRELKTRLRMRSLSTYLRLLDYDEQIVTPNQLTAIHFTPVITFALPDKTGGE